MEALRHWFKSSGPVVKTLMAISVTSGLVVCHRLFYAPYVRRKRYGEAEAWANEILEQEERMQETGEPYSDNYNLRY